MNKGLRIVVALVLLAGILILGRGQMAWAGGPARPAEAGATPTATPGGEGGLSATVTDITGPVEVRANQDSSFTKAVPGFVLELLGQAQTQTAGKVRLDFSTGTIVRLGPNTLFTLQPAEAAAQGLGIRLKMTLGKIWVILNGGTLHVDTPSGVAAVQGSYLSVTIGPDGHLRITCLEGDCTESTNGGTVYIVGGQTAEADGPDDPPRVGVMTAQDYQDWFDNSPESASLVRQASTVNVPPATLPLIAVTGSYSVGGVCTFKVIELKEGYGLNADLLPYSSLGTRPDTITSYLAGVCRAVYGDPSGTTIDELGSNGQVEVCFAGGPDMTGTIYEYDPWETTTGPASGETWTPLTTTEEDGLLCAPAQLSAKYFLAETAP
jgi:FecR protein